MTGLRRAARATARAVAVVMAVALGLALMLTLAAVTGMTVFLVLAATLGPPIDRVPPWVLPTALALGTVLLLSAATLVVGYLAHIRSEGNRRALSVSLVRDPGRHHLRARGGVRRSADHGRCGADRTRQQSAAQDGVDGDRAAGGAGGGGVQPADGAVAGGTADGPVDPGLDEGDAGGAVHPAVDQQHAEEPSLRATTSRAA